MVDNSAKNRQVLITLNNLLVGGWQINNTKTYKMAQRKNLLVTLADKNYVSQAKQLFSSVYWNAGWEGDYMLLSHEIPEKDLIWFSNKGILIKECRSLHDNNIAYTYSHVVLDKFYLFTEEFKKWNIVVFLDADIIVKSSLNGLIKIKHFSAVQDCYINKLHTQFFMLNFQKIKINSNFYNFNRAAFNSGVMSFNTNIITSHTFNELTSLFKEYGSASKYGEQPVMNLYFYNKWKKLPLFYNTIISSLNYKIPSFLQPIVLHFIRYNDRPPLWDPQHPFYLEWKTNLEKAEFIDLNVLQKVQEQNTYFIRYYSMILKLYYLTKMKREKLRFFYLFRLKPLYFCIKESPGRILGTIGIIIKKNNPDLYHKIRKTKGGK